MSSIIRLVLLFCCAWLFILLVFVVTQEKRMLVRAETTGTKNRPNPIIPSSQNFNSGFRARFTPKKEKLMEKISFAVVPTAAWTAATFSGVMREAR